MDCILKFINIPPNFPKHTLKTASECLHIAVIAVTASYSGITCINLQNSTFILKWKIP